ncbi:dTDP-4-amino-4,6-dideoxygalactose transaminase, partial [Streptomyces sp. P17]|nr:dTDP-4-amino-4,6-dideoxygalactose transaminase [Streptomyces sp. P17]
SWQAYYDSLLPLQEAGKIKLPTIPATCTQNAHIFYLKVADLSERTALLEYLKANDIQAVFHYVPLHSAKAGKKFGRFNGDDYITTSHSE